MVMMSHDEIRVMLTGRKFFDISLFSIRVPHYFVMREGSQRSFRAGLCKYRRPIAYNGLTDNT